MIGESVAAAAGNGATGMADAGAKAIDDKNNAEAANATNLMSRSPWMCKVTLAPCDGMYHTPNWFLAA